MSNKSLYEMADGIVKMLDEIDKLNETRVREYCASHSLDANNAGDYATAVQATLDPANEAPEITNYERWLLSNYTGEELHYSKTIASGCISCDNQHNIADMHKFETSMYGLWRNIERAVKKLRKGKGVSWIKDRPEAIRDETRKGVSLVKKKFGMLKDDLTEPAIRVGLRGVSRTLLLVKEDYDKCTTDARRSSDHPDSRYKAKMRRCNNVAMSKVRISLKPMKRLIKKDAYRFQFNDMMREQSLKVFLRDFKKKIYMLESVYPEYKGYFNWMW